MVRYQYQEKNKYRYIFVYQNMYTKFINLYPTAEIKGVTAIRILRQHVKDNRKPEFVLTDRGKQFTSKRWKETLIELKISGRWTSIRNPQSNPVERMMKEITRLIRTICYSQHILWSEHVEKVALLININLNDGIGMSPYTLHTGLPNPNLTNIIPQEHTKVILVTFRIF